MGYDIPAPSLMQLARQGVLFRQCHASAPSCGPSRAALLTGQYPHCCGMLGLPSPGLGYRLNDYGHHLGAFLRQHGYATALSGVQHVARAPWAPMKESLPYDEFLNHTDPTPAGQNYFDPAQTVPAAVDFLMRPHDRPFFLSVGFLDPHRAPSGDERVFIMSQPARQPADIDERARYCQPWPHLPDNAITRREMANFKLGVEMLDRDVGRLLAALDTPELRSNTLVIFTTDHGPGIPEMKCTLTDRGTGAVLIMRGPDDPQYGEATAFRGGRVIDAMTQHLDLYPTICDLLVADHPAWLDGKSLMPLIHGETDEIHDAIFTEQTYHHGADPRPLRAVRTTRFKYIRSFKPDQQRAVDRGPSLRFWEEHGYGSVPLPDEALFDLMFDPNEAANLAGSEAHAGILESMRQRLQEWMRSTGDPLVDGVVPAPPVGRQDAS